MSTPAPKTTSSAKASTSSASTSTATAATASTSTNQKESQAKEPKPVPTASDRVMAQIKYEHKILQSMKQSQKEAHHKRMQSLRKELDYLNSTAWQFETNGPF